MTKIPLGKVAFTDAGSYNAEKTYKRFDFIDTEDSSYLSLQNNNKGHAVTETAWWKCLARGTKATEAAKKASEAAALANEKAVALFLDRKICFLEIYDLIQGAMEHHQVIENPSVEQILEAEGRLPDVVMACIGGRKQCNWFLFMSLSKMKACV